MDRPIIGITCDTVADHTPAKWKYESPHEYSRAVATAGGLPWLMPYETDCIEDYLRLCDGFLLSGGDDPDLSTFGQSVHPKAKLMHHARQDFEWRLLDALDGVRHPVLGVCLGMQMMSLHAGGRLHQHLPDVPDFDEARAAAHQKNVHEIRLSIAPHEHIVEGRVHSRHHQAVADAGALRVVAEFDGVIEAVDRSDGAPRFYLGVQWHPEVTDDPNLGMGLIKRLVGEARRYREARREKVAGAV